MTRDLLLRGAHLPEGRRVDVRLSGPVVADVMPAGVTPAEVTSTGAMHDGRPGDGLDLTGYLLLPAPAEPHAHLDKAYSADQVANPTGDLVGAVLAWLRYRPDMTHGDVVGRATAAVWTYLAHGATAVRTHVDVAEDVGLRALHAVLEVREALRHECAIQVVAFVGLPLAGSAGAGNRALLRDALAAGADVVGGCPPLDADPLGCIDACLAAAAAAGVPVDLHVDETLEPGVRTLDLLARRVTETEFPHAVTASHCVSLGALPAEEARATAELAASAGIAVVTLPQTNLYLQGRDHPVLTPRGLTALRVLRAAGVPVAAGGDNLQDPFNCVGRGDPLETAALLVLAGHESPAAAYAAVSTASRRALGLPEAAVLPGAAAELLAIRATSIREAVATATSDRLVFHSGRLVARTTVEREFFPHEGPVPRRGEPGSPAMLSATPSRRPV